MSRALRQISCKVFPALAAGCTTVLKLSKVTSLNAALFAEILDAAGVPNGVFNLINGDGATVGEAMFLNAGQSCNAPSRMLVPASRHDEAVVIAKTAAKSTTMGDPNLEDSKVGLIVSKVPFDKTKALIRAGIDEGATLVCGGTGLPDGIRQRAERHDDRARGDFRPGALHAALPRRRGRHRYRERHALRVFRLCVERRPWPRAARRYGTSAGRHRSHERCPTRFQRAVRRLQAVGQRPRSEPSPPGTRPNRWIAIRLIQTVTTGWIVERPYSAA
jgi:hypothetical protein